MNLKCEVRTDKSFPRVTVFGITRLCLEMPNSDPRDRFVGPYLKLMIDFFLAHFFVPTLELITILP